MTADTKALKGTDVYFVYIDLDYILKYLVKGFPLKSATWRALQYEMLSGISIISARNKSTS